MDAVAALSDGVKRRQMPAKEPTRDYVQLPNLV
jgi:hypothetical protein